MLGSIKMSEIHHIASYDDNWHYTSDLRKDISVDVVVVNELLGSTSNEVISV